MSNSCCDRVGTAREGVLTPCLLGIKKQHTWCHVPGTWCYVQVPITRWQVQNTVDQVPSSGYRETYTNDLIPGLGTSTTYLQAASETHGSWLIVTLGYFRTLMSQVREATHPPMPLTEGFGIPDKSGMVE